MALDPSIIVIGGLALGGVTALCMIRKHKRELNQRVRPMFVKSDDVTYLPLGRRATVLDVRVKSGQAQYNIDLFGYKEWINEAELARWEPKKSAPAQPSVHRRTPHYGPAPSPVADAAKKARDSREHHREEQRRRNDSDDILSNPIHPLSPLNTTRHYDDSTPSRSSYDDCGSSSRSSSSHSHSSHSCGSSSSSSDSSSSSSDSGSSSSD